MSPTYQLDKRCQEILKNILYANGYITVQELTDQMHVSKRSIYYDIKKINDWLLSNHLNELIQERRKGITVNSSQISEIQSLLMEENPNQVVFSPKQRIHLIICDLVIAHHKLGIEDFMALCDVSRNTIVNDLKGVSEQLKNLKLKLNYSSHQGYRILGDAIKKRALFFLYFPEFIPYFDEKTDNFTDRNKNLEKLKQIEKELHTEYVSDVLPTLAVFISSLKNSRDKLSFKNMDVDEIMNTKEYMLVCKYFPNLIQNEQIYISLHLLGSRLQTIPVNVMKEDKESNQFAQALVKAFEDLSGVYFQNVDDLVRAIDAHLQTSMYRYRYGIQLGNPMLDNIKNEYWELFNLTKRAVQRVQKHYGFTISDSEIAYLTLHFGAFITPKGQPENQYRILIVCPNGIGTGNMLRSEVASLVPQATEIQNIPRSHYQPNNQYDVVISTVVLPEEKNLIIVHPILTDQDRVAILRKCMTAEPHVRIQIDEIIDIASKYIDVNHLNDFQKDIQNYFSDIKVRQAPQKDYGYKLKHYLKPSHIQVCTQHMDWDNALRLSCQPLLRNGSIDETYIDKIIADQKEKQLYMFLADGLVLAHTAAEYGSHHIDVALTTFKEPVRFLNNKDAKIIIAISTEDQTKHIRILNDLLSIFSKRKNIDHLVSLNDNLDIYTYIMRYLEEEK